MPDFKFTRAPDWPPELHRAADQFESAVVQIAKTLDPERFQNVLGKLEVAQRRMGRAILALDRKRRPEIYRK